MIRARPDESPRAAVETVDFCNCVICGGGPVQCQFALPSPREWPPEPIEEFAARHQERVEGERHNGINDEHEVTHDGE